MRSFRNTHTLISIFITQEAKQKSRRITQEKNLATKAIWFTGKVGVTPEYLF